ncbi:MAG: hypothetical protein DWQ01_06965 [Planctomycetota bacterium]|nr:MAG: hypothetical protein DWQ01_06965 [Planctomycetota bacterium]
MLALSTVCLVALVAQADEAAAKAPDPGLDRYRAVLAKYQKAKALEMDFHLRFTPLQEEKEEAGEEMNDFKVSMRVMRGAAGHIQMSEPSQSMEFTLAGDGEGVFMLDHERKIKMPIGEDFSMIGEMVPLAPMVAWIGEAPKEPKEIEVLPGPEEFPILTGLRFQEGANQQTLWLTPDNRVIAAFFIQDQGEAYPKVRYDLQFSSVRLLDEAEVEDFAYDIPEEYEQPDESEFAGEQSFEASLLAVGSEAPEVEFSDLGGASFDLASLKGKTVLLNFWFRH